MQPNLEQAYSLLMSTSPTEAMEYILAQADQIFQTELDYQFFQAILSYYMGDTDKCYGQFLEIFEELLQNPNRLFDWWEGMELIDVLLLNDHTDQAMALIDIQLKINPVNPSILNEQGLVYYLKLQFEDAINSYKKALAIIPDAVPIMVNLGLAYSKTGRAGLALEWLEKAIQNDDEELSSSSLAINEIIKNMIERTGECDSCKGQALCCKNMKLRLNEGYVYSEHNYKQVLALDPRNANWIHSGTDTDGSWIFNCNFLYSAGRCSNHADRPQTCRNFPDVFYAKDKFPECSYNFKLKNNLPEFTSMKVEKAINTELLKLKLIL